MDLHIPDVIQKERLDKVLSDLCPDISRSRLKQFILDGCVQGITGPLTDPSQKISGPIQLTLIIPEAEPLLLQPEDIPLDILFEDEDVIVLNKPAGLVVHPAVGHGKGTLVHALLHHCGDQLSGIGGVKRPGIVHRLDKETSGLMVVAKNDLAHQKLSAQFQDRSLSRLYTAYVWGLISSAGTVTGNIGRSQTNRQKMALYFDKGKPAITHYQPQRIYGTLVTKIQCQLETGRTHQIRVHMTSIGHGLINDPLYGSPKRGINPQIRNTIQHFSSSPSRQALHAHALHFIHPRTHDMMQFEIDLPTDLKHLESILEDITNS